MKVEGKNKCCWENYSRRWRGIAESTQEVLGPEFSSWENHRVSTLETHMGAQWRSLGTMNTDFPNVNHAWPINLCVSCDKMTGFVDKGRTVNVICLNTGWVHRAVVNGSRSNYRPVTSGAPQQDVWPPGNQTSLSVTWKRPFLCCWEVLLYKGRSDIRWGHGISRNSRDTEGFQGLLSGNSDDSFGVPLVLKINGSRR